MKNLRFNRNEKNGRNEYLDSFCGIRSFDDYAFEGFIKCKLVHSAQYSIVTPDQIYLDVGGEMCWIQPLYFVANLIARYDGVGYCSFGVDISHGLCLQIKFRDDGIVSRLADGSLFYACTIKGPRDIYRYRTGRAKIVNNTPFLKLYHHTAAAAAQKIRKSNEFLSSNWNIQGTKKSTNISYLYLTSLPKISCVEDLEVIAMSSKGRLAFRVDENFSQVPDLILHVYRESTENRTHALAVWVESSKLATQPCYRHALPAGVIHYAIVSPFIHRVGVEFGTTVKIVGDTLVPYASKNFDYAVVGDATSAMGLIAPYDEENTKEILKVQYVDDRNEIISFWMNHGNSDQFYNKKIEIVTFK